MTFECKYAQAVGQYRSPGFVLTACPPGSACGGSCCGQPWWSASAGLASSSRSQLAIRTARTGAPLTSEVASIDAHRHPSLTATIVTHLGYSVSLHSGSSPDYQLGLPGN